MKKNQSIWLLQLGHFELNIVSRVGEYEKNKEILYKLRIILKISTSVHKVNSHVDSHMRCAIWYHLYN